MAYFPRPSLLLCQALELSRKGWTLVDFRLATEFDALHAEGAINVPMYRCVW
jgi:rhodanese-related sulfurtransferase